MKKIIFQNIKGFDGKDIEDTSRTNPLDRNKKVLINTKDVILKHLGSFVGQDGQENISAYTVGMKIATKSSETGIELEDAEFEMVKRSLIGRPVMTALVVGQTLKSLEDS